MNFFKNYMYYMNFFYNYITRNIDLNIYFDYYTGN